MISIHSFNEMSHAVPGSLVSRPMESPLECEVPSPSQWSDPCRSPLSLHSPPHYSDLDKLKEEPFSPQSFYTSLASSPPPRYPFMNKEGAESSLNLAALVAENEALVHRVQQQQEAPSPPQGGVTPQEEDSLNQLAFLDSLVDIKREIVEPDLPVSSSTSVLIRTVTEAPSVVPVAPVSSPADFLNAVEMMALEHFRQDLHLVSNRLCIPKDPTIWTPANVRAWLSFQASLLQEIPPPNLDHWQISGLALVSLNEAQFRELIPQGGELLYAKLEIWKEAFRTTMPQQCSPPRILSSPAPVTQSEAYQPSVVIQYPHPQSSSQQISSVRPSGHSPSLLQSKLQQPISQQQLQSILSPPTQTQARQQLGYSMMQSSSYQSPQPQALTSLLISSPKVITSPPPPPPVAPTPQPPQSPSSSVHSIHVPSSQLPTVVVQAGSSQGHQGSAANKVQLQSSSASALYVSKSKSPRVKKELEPHQQVVPNPFLEEAMDITSLLQSDLPSSTPISTSQTVIDPQLDQVQESEGDQDGGESCSAAAAAAGTAVTSGRSGSHIHLWQFLKELLQQPQHYGSCIRWLDRQKGVFKIEDSVRVARLWGKRKNRPAMNYDKLSRSIRQYYKKGIMKKTERSQRLVYQFCNPYNL